MPIRLPLVIALAGLLSAGCADEGQLAPLRAALQLSLVANRDSVNPQDTVRFTITIRNNGMTEATNVVAFDSLPAGLSVVSVVTTRGSFANGMWTIGTLAPDASAVMSMLTRTAAGTGGQTLVKRIVALTATGGNAVLNGDSASRQVIVLAPAAPAPPATPPPAPAPAPSQPGSTLFASSWAAVAGSTEAAVTDGGRWNEASYCGRGDILSVVSGASVGFSRAASVFAVAMRGDGCGFIQRRGFAPAGTSHWGRMYFRNDETQMGGSMHNFSYNFLGDIQLVFFNRKAVPGGWTLDFGANAPFPFTSWALQPGVGSNAFNPPRIVLQNGVWYRYEWHMEFLAGNTRYRLWPRVYNAAGTLLYDASNFYQQSTPTQGTATLASWYAAGNSFAVRNLSLMTNIGIGNEGRVPSPNNGQFWYVGNFAIGTAGWLGQ